MDNQTLNGPNRIYNYWFTTEFRIKFFYRGGETFQFNGDDDLWVFIDNKLTSCDLGSIHEARMCTLKLDDLGLLQNATYDMTILRMLNFFVFS
jgi:fibro-slime domain-containing protein